jgi:hypothetical protein
MLASKSYGNSAVLLKIWFSESNNFTDQTLVSPASIESSWLRPNYYYARTHHQAPAWSNCMF